jgi:hypothetical protein
MTSDFLFHFLFRCLVVNYAALLVWFFALVLAKGWIRRLHGKLFNLSDATFDAIHYGGMAIYKIGILLFNPAPLVALCLVRNGS